MILPGDNTLRVNKAVKGHRSIYDIYQFDVINLKGDTHGFCYQVPAGTRPYQLVRDLIELNKRNLWFMAYLKEVNNLLAIHTIKEPREPQAELWKFAQKYKRQTPREYKRLTGESLLVH